MLRKGCNILIAFLLLFLIIGCSARDGSTPSNETNPKAQYSWVVEPKFDYSGIDYDRQRRIYYVSLEGQQGRWLVDTDTGELMDKVEILGYGGPDIFACDPKKNKYAFINEGDEIRLYDLDSIFLDMKSNLVPVVHMEILIDEASLKDRKYLKYNEDVKEYDIQVTDFRFTNFAVTTRQGPVTEFIFEDYDKFYSNIMAMKIDGKWGFVDMSGKFIIDPVFEDAISIDDEHAFVKHNGKWGIIRKGIVQ